MKLNWNEFSPWDCERADIIKILQAKVSILEILDFYGIECTKVSNGNFTHRACCPFTFHKGGEERTPSFFVSETNNSFHCFGCNSNSDVVGFVRLYNNTCLNIAIEELCKIAGITSVDLNLAIPTVPKRKPEETIEYYITRSGNDIREFLKTKEGKRGYISWCAWADQKFGYLDKMLDNWDDDKWEKAKKVYESVLKQIRGDK